MSFLAFIVGGLFLIWSLLPLFKKDSTWISLHMESDELEDRKQRVYGNIADLEFDYAMGRLSEKDFNEIRKLFLAEAGRVIQKLEDQKSSKLMDQIKRDATQLSGKKKARKGKSEHTCSKCGHENLRDARFCSQCGKELT